MVYLDTETTDLNPGQICELSLIKVEGGKVELAKNYFFKVDSMGAGAQATHGFSLEDLEVLSGGKTFADYKDELLEILAGQTIVAHNLPFDEKFISSEFWRCKTSLVLADRVDTMRYFTDILRIPARYKKNGQFKFPKLGEVVDYFGLSTQKIMAYSESLFGNHESKAHDSRYDTTAMLVVYLIQKEIEAGGDSWLRAFHM